MQDTEQAMLSLAAALPEIRPLLREHLQYYDEEMLPHLLIADVERWAEAEAERSKPSAALR